MRRSWILLLVLILAPALAYAQDSDGRRGQGYIFAAPGGLSAAGSTVGTFHFGAGGEGLLYKGLGGGGEIGYLFPTRAAGDGFGILSLNGSYHFVDSNKPRKVVPFVTLGYSRGFGQGGGFNMVNYGGGVNWGMRDRLGLRVEGRDHVTTETPRGHFWQFRVALAFR